MRAKSNTACAQCGAPLHRAPSVLRKRPTSFCDSRCISAFEMGNTRHYSHGMSHTKEHQTWVKMRQRCGNPNDPSYPRYGARGIAVCEEWQRSFAAFFRDMGAAPSAKHSIERVDNDRGYSPDNCIWALHVVQVRNRRITVTLTYSGRTLPVSVWAEEVGLQYKTLWHRVHDLGWSTERALTTPAQVHQRTNP